MLIPVVARTVVNTPVDGVVLPIAPVAAKVAPLRDDAFKFGTLVVLATMSGAVPVATVDCKVRPCIKAGAIKLPEFNVKADPKVKVLLADNKEMFPLISLKPAPRESSKLIGASNVAPAVNSKDS